MGIELNSIAKYFKVMAMVQLTWANLFWTCFRNLDWLSNSITSNSFIVLNQDGIENTLLSLLCGRRMTHAFCSLELARKLIKDPIHCMRDLISRQ